MRKKMKSETSAGSRINSVDIMVILLCIVCIAGMVFRFGMIENVELSATKHTVTVSYVIEGISDTSVEYLSQGDEVFFSDDKGKIGTLSSTPTSSPSIVYVYGDDGSITQKASANGKVDVKGTFTAYGEMTDSGFMLNGTTYIAPNMTISIETQNIALSMLIVDISIVENQ